MTRRRPSFLRLCALVAVAVLALAACGSDDGAAPAGTPDAGGGSSILQFTAKTLDGRTVEGASYTGRPVAFWFWAPT